MKISNFMVKNEILVRPDIHVFLLNINENVNYIKTNLIPKSQLDSVNKFNLYHDRVKRLLARSFLFELLHKYYGILDFNLDFNAYGKPFLKSALSLDFSFSYSRDYILVGLATDKRIGIDIEYLNPTLNIDEIAAEIMCLDESEQFHLLSRHDARKKFCIEIFSAKESIIKAYGTGLFFDVKKINVLIGDLFDYDGYKFTYRPLGSWDEKYVMALCYEDNLR